ncbi:8-oxoguanine DNA glycosylase [Desulfovibrio aminophilus]|nr:8-oxoguanine DNA glycosylase [Desulfovibrio aminophilus]MCM0754812.1 8-oxoguanine DNA glycosylase [Desulfovibrio aminophilus]
MSRVIGIVINEQIVKRIMPCSEEQVLPGIEWGDPWRLFTPAYWLVQAWMAGLDTKPLTKHRACNGVVDELVFCLLGGYGITAEMAMAAYEQCRRAGIIEARETRQEVWADTLNTPLTIDGRYIRYRYPNQKAKYIALAMRIVHNEPLHLESGLMLRDQLLHIPGVGYKTASWVARNVLDCDDVAILDIHIIRAGNLCGLFTKNDRVEKDYRSMECRFLSFCQALGMRPAVLDCVIWDGMREAGNLPIRALNQKCSTLASKKKSGRERSHRFRLEM